MDLRLYDFKKIGITIFVIVALMCAVIIPIPFIQKEKARQEAYKLEVQEAQVALELAQREKELLPDSITNYNMAQIRKLDLSLPSGITAAELKPVLRKGLVGLENDFVEAEETYNVNAVFLVSIAALESAWGTINFRPNNMFGYGEKGYATKRDNIMDVAKGLGTRYLAPGGGLYSGKTIDGVHKRYASSSTWDDKVGKNMVTLYAEINNEKVKALKNQQVEADQKILELSEKLEILRQQENQEN